MRRRKTRPPPDFKFRELFAGRAAGVKHRGDVLSGTLWTCTASSLRRGKESTSGGPGVWRGPRNRAQDAALFGPAGVPAGTSGEATEAGAMAVRDRSALARFVWDR